MHNKISIRIILITTCLLFISYMLLWWHMPLYPDEVAFAMMKSRYFYDGGYSFFMPPIPSCPGAEIKTPISFIPSAMIYSFFYMQEGWSYIRFFPTLVVCGFLIFIYSKFLNHSSTRILALFPAVGLLGVSGSSLVMNRPEAFFTFVLLCLFISSWYVYYSNSKNTIVSFILFTVIFFNLTLALYVHVIGILLLPISLVCMINLLSGVHSWKNLLFVILIFILIFILNDYYNVWFNKPSAPGCDFSASFTALKLLMNLDLGGFLKLLAKITAKHLSNFFFKSSYTINYLPSLANTLQRHYGLISAINGTIVISLVSVLLLSIYLFIINLIEYCQNLIANFKTKSKPISLLLTSCLYDFSLVIVLGFTFCFISLFLDSDAVFYRSFSSFFCLTMICCMAIPHALQQNKIKILLIKIICYFGFFSFILSYITALYNIVPLLFKHEGPSISLYNKNWTDYNNKINAFTKKCGVDNNTTNIVVDDLTYDALKQHKKLIPISYLNMYCLNSGTALLDEMKKLGVNAIITRCSNLPYDIIDPNINLCCKNVWRQTK